MKKIIVALIVFLIAAPSFAAQVSCEQFGRIAYNATQERDRGEPQEEVVRNIKKNFSDSRIEGIVKVVFMHQDQDAEAMQFAVRLWCLQEAESPQKPEAPKVSEDTSAPVSTPPAAPIVASGYGHVFDVCMSKSNGVTVEMLDCTAAETSKQDNALNQSYHLAMATLPPDRRLELRNTQRAWIKNRDSKCALDQDGGTAAQINSASCVLDMTAQRAKDLIAVMPR